MEAQMLMIGIVYLFIYTYLKTSSLIVNCCIDWVDGHQSSLPFLGRHRIRFNSLFVLGGHHVTLFINGMWAEVI